MTFEELNSPVVTEETPTVEPETTTPSTSETETTPTTESPEGDESTADTSDQPEVEDKTPRAQKRIQELTRKNKELEEKASYWEQLKAKVPDAPPEDNEDGAVTVDGIADAVLRKQQAAQIEQIKQNAATAMQKDALEALTAHPELETDHELADMVVAYAEKNGISFTAAANRIKARMSAEQKKAETKLLATNAVKAGASSPSGVKVSNGQTTSVNLSTMTEDEKRANWDQVLASMG